MADAVLVDAGACLTLGAATGDDGCATTTTAGAIVAGASGFGRMAARCDRAAGLRAFACASNCRAASRVRQYPVA
jgi:hypothetical protein